MTAIFNKAIIFFLIIIFSLHNEVLPQHAKYYINMKIDPARSSTECTVKILNPGDSCFFLTSGMLIKQIVADGKAAAFLQKRSSLAPYSNEISIESGIPDELIIEYLGTMEADSFPKSINQINMIKAGLVELSNFIDWYPRMKNFKPFSFKLDVQIPEGYLSIANGLLNEKESDAALNLYCWESVEPVYGITFFAAPEMQKASAAGDGITIEIYYSRLPESYIDSMKTDLLKSMKLLTDMFGKPGSKNLVQVIYSPRSAGAYARAPLFLVSEKYAYDQRSQKFGPARDLRLNIHEISHYWSLADTETPEDWINEGLAEFSALLVSEAVISSDFSEMMIKEYENIVNTTITETPIIETGRDSWEREINRYYKPALLLNDIRNKFGDEKLKMFLKSVYLRFFENEKATTEIFLEELERIIGKEAKEYFSVAIHRKKWNNTKVLSDYIYSETDSVFLGTWTGPLTQFGSTVKFVLNIYLKDGKLNATLDSPDHNVKDIPVSGIRISGDQLIYSVGPASASFLGYLNRIENTVSGEWNQRGVAYPLLLSKEKVKKNN